MSASAGFSDAYSHPSMFDPFGSMPFTVAGALQKQFARPFTLGFGKKSPAQQSFIGGANQFLPSYLPTLTNLSGNIAAGANSAYGGYQNAVDQFMNQLPGFERSAGQATSAAQTALSDVMSPLQSRASFQEASRRALAPTRQGLAARGMLEGGEGQAAEQALTSDLAFKTLQTDAERQQAAIQGLTGAVGTQAGISGLGPQVMQALFQAYPQLAQVLSGAAQLPMGGLGQILQLLTGTQQPSYDLLKMILPQMGQTSRTHAATASGGYGGSSSTTSTA